MCLNEKIIIGILKPYQRPKLNSFVSRKLVSISSIKMEPYVGANFVSVAGPDIFGGYLLH